MMLRLCVEQLLTELGYKQKNLVDKIKAAAPEGSNLHLILDACRLAGNEFVHAGTIEELDKSGHQPRKRLTQLKTDSSHSQNQLNSIPKTAILTRRLSAVARMAQSLQVVLVPHEERIPLVRPDVVDVGRQLDNPALLTLNT